MTQWTPISEKPKRSGTYLVFARSADPKRPLRHLSFYDKRTDEWLGLVSTWQEAVTHWAEFPPDPPREAVK